MNSAPLADVARREEVWLRPLSPREQEILDLLVLGLNNKQIGNCLYLSEKTVRNALTEIYGKLDVANRTRAALLWSNIRQSEQDR